MSIISLFVTVIIAGFILWVILQIPLPAPFKNILLGLATLLLVLYLLQVFGIWNGFHLHV